VSGTDEDDTESGPDEVAADEAEHDGDRDQDQNPGRRPARSERYVVDLVVGGIVSVLGIGVTVWSYSAASGGGRYVVATGAIVYGLFRLGRGLFGMLAPASHYDESDAADRHADPDQSPDHDHDHDQHPDRDQSEDHDRDSDLAIPKARIVESTPDGFLASRTPVRWEIWLVIAVAFALLIPGLWSYSLVDPWETHYAEVARRMLQDDDWVHLNWQNEGFRSKPVLTFWLIAGSMDLHGIGAGGGYSGEMVSSSWVVFSIRLPFTLFGIMGLVMTWWMLARLVSRRVAWIAFLIIGTTPFYFFVARQAITDMPLVGCMMGAMACFAMALQAEEDPLRPIWKKLNSFHMFVAVIVLIVGWQAFYYWSYFSKYPNLAAGVRVWHPEVLLPVFMVVGLAFFVVWTFVLQPVKRRREVYMLWFYTLLAISTLGKGLPAIGLAGVICLFYLLLTGHWRLLTKLEIPRGVLLCVLIVVPWHFGMWLKDGRPFLRDYFMTHLWRRATAGVHGERGTFDFFISQLGIGMWPWVALLPAAIAGAITNIRPSSTEGRVRLIVGIWAIVSIAFFSAIQTKFHHYIFPAVPALAIMIAFWIEDLLMGRVRRMLLVTLSGIVILLIITNDLMGEQKQFIEMFVYRYDRPWPSKPPWSIDLSDTIFTFGIVFSIGLALLAVRKVRAYALGAFAFVAVLFAYWGMNVYMGAAGQHWGMRDAVRGYYEQRTLRGADIQYFGLRQLSDEWKDFDGHYRIETFLPDTVSVGQQMVVDIDVYDSGGREVRHEVELHGTISDFRDHHVWIAISERETAKLDELIAQGVKRERSSKRPWKQVNADRLIAWQLYWRGENFWSGDEIWGRSKATRTAFKQTDNKAFLEYLNTYGVPGQTYFVMTEAGRANNLKNVLPTKRGKDTWQILDTSSNKFTLLSFIL
jgi:4-amino-4-deoxy-L-arabinose transferase-like glycosyltransferase